MHTDFHTHWDADVPEERSLLEAEVEEECLRGDADAIDRVRDIAQDMAEHPTRSPRVHKDQWANVVRIINSVRP